jgi:hypothetical protein
MADHIANAVELLLRNYLNAKPASVSHGVTVTPTRTRLE